MAKQVINVGAAANDGTGDPLRTAMQKVNLNFTELYDADDAAFGGSYEDLTDKPDIPSDLTDLGITDGNAGQFLSTDGSGNFSFANTGGGGGGAVYTNANVDAHINVSAAGNNEVLAWSGTDYEWVEQASGGGGLSNNAIIDLVTGADLDMGGNKVLFNNVYSLLSDLPSASSYHGMFAHVHDTGKAYYAHSGAWIRLANYDELGSGGGSNTSTFAELTEVDAADLDVHDIGVQAKTTHVMTPNGSSAYRSDIYGTTDNPTIHVRAGETIAFDLSSITSSHPFQIETAGGAAYSTGLIHIAPDGTKSTAANAQGKTSGTLYWKVPGSISGTYKYICTVHGAMIGDIEIEAAAGAGGGSSLQSRTDVTATTGTLANNAAADLSITGFKGYALMAIETDKAAWVRVYVNGATRTADASRLDTADPLPDAGVIAEVITTGAETVIVSPGTIGYSLESTPNTTIPLRVENRSGSTGTVQVTLTVLQLEA
jgi:plastocyanin